MLYENIHLHHFKYSLTFYKLPSVRLGNLPSATVLITLHSKSQKVPGV